MEPLKLYDYLSRSRQLLFDAVRPRTAEEYTRQFSIGLGSLGRTLTHIMICEYAYVLRIEGRPVPPYEQFPFQDENPPPFAALETAWTQQAGRTRDVLRSVHDWNAEMEYRSMWGDPPPIVVASAADLFTQLAFHEVHHRAQAMNMLRQLGVTPGDIDYSAIMFQRREARCLAAV